MHKSITGGSYWEEIKDDIIHMYLDLEYKTKDIADKYNCWPSTILYKLKEWNVPRRKRCNAKYKLNSVFFKHIDNERKAYWYGFLFADGHVNDKCVMLTLQKDDQGLLEQYKKDIGSTAPISFDSHGNPGLNIACKDMCEDLLNKGFNNRKSYYADFDKIISYVPNNLLHHFIRGFFDGDGCVGIYNYSYLSKAQCHFSIIGLLNVCEYIKNLFHIKSQIAQDSENSYTIKTRDADLIVGIFDYMYKDATIYLPRKYEKFKQIKLMTFNDYNGDIHDNG